MARESAAALMDRIYRQQRHIYDLTRRPYLLGRDGLIEELAPRPGDRVLEIGCGTARNLIVAARRHPHARFHGIDLSSAMLETARSAVARARLADRITLARADATAFDAEDLFGVRRFEHVMLSYSLSMIPNWRAALEMALRATTPGGRVMIVDFGEQEGLPRWFRGALRRWLAIFHVTPRIELEAALHRCAVARRARLAVARPYRGYAQRLTLTLPD